MLRALIGTDRVAVRFRKIVEADIDPTRVTLRVLTDDRGIVSGRVSTLAYGPAGVELMSTEDADPPIATAIDLATKLAAFKAQDVDVVDPDALWRGEWGVLREA